MVSLFITAIGVIFTCCTQFPGAIALTSSFLPLSYGFSKIFNLSMSQAMWLSFPALFGNFYGFVWAYGRQLSSMAKSGLMPEILGTMTHSTDTPYVALFVGLLMSFVLALLCFYNVFYPGFSDDVKHMYMLSSYIVYDFMFVSYIVFKFKYSSLPRSFSSPFGIFGAFAGLLVFAVNTIAILVQIRNELYPFYALLVAALLMIIYYLLFLQKEQHFSEEEKEQLFKAYLINANVKSRLAVKNHRKNGSRGGSVSDVGIGTSLSRDDHHHHHLAHTDHHATHDVLHHQAATAASNHNHDEFDISSYDNESLADVLVIRRSSVATTTTTTSDTRASQSMESMMTAATLTISKNALIDALCWLSRSNLLLLLIVICV